MHWWIFLFDMPFKVETFCQTILQCCNHNNIITNHCFDIENSFDNIAECVTHDCLIQMKWIKFGQYHKKCNMQSGKHSNWNSYILSHDKMSTNNNKISDIFTCFSLFKKSISNKSYTQGIDWCPADAIHSENHQVVIEVPIFVMKISFCVVGWIKQISSCRRDEAY